MLHVSPIGDNADTSPTFSPTGLLDSPAAEQADARPDVGGGDTFDPAGLYVLEQERDWAASLLAESFPGVAVTLNRVENTHRYADGRWNTNTRWLALVCDALGNVDVAAGGDSPADAVNDVITAQHKAHARIRPHPEHGSIVASTFEAFGRVNPGDAADLLAHVAAHHGRSDFLTVEPDGRVLLVGGSFEPGESFDVGQLVADFIHIRTPGAADAESAVRVIDEPDGDTFRSWVILPSGRRLAGARCFTRAEAQSMGDRVRRALRPTIAPAAVATVAAPLTAA